MNPLEAALRERYAEVSSNIGKLEAQKKAYGDKTHWRTVIDKKWRDAFNEKVQIEHYKVAELRMVASRAQIKL